MLGQIYVLLTTRLIPLIFAAVPRTGTINPPVAGIHFSSGLHAWTSNEAFLITLYGTTYY